MWGSDETVLGVRGGDGVDGGDRRLLIQTDVGYLSPACSLRVAHFCCGPPIAGYH